MRNSLLLGSTLLSILLSSDHIGYYREEFKTNKMIKRDPIIHKKKLDDYTINKIDTLRVIKQPPIKKASNLESKLNGIALNKEIVEPSKVVSLFKDEDELSNLELFNKTNLMDDWKNYVFEPKYSFEIDKKNPTFVKTLPIIGGSIVTLGGLRLYYTNQWWWKNRGEFHYFEDWGYAKGFDKFGHLVAGNIISSEISNFYEMAGYNNLDSRLLGFGTTMLITLFAEYHEGFATSAGFDRADQLFTTIGAVKPIVEYYVPGLDEVQLKLTLNPIKFLRVKDHPGNTWNYSGTQKYFINYHIGKPFKGASIGIGANLDDERLYKGNWEFYLCLDLNITKVYENWPTWAKVLAYPFKYLVSPLSPGIKLTKNKDIEFKLSMY